MSSSSDALSWAWRQEPGRPTAKFLLVALAGETTRVKDGPYVAEPGLARLVKLTGMNESTVVRNIRMLITAGCITRERGVSDESGRRSRDKFTLHVTVVAAVATRASSQQAKRKPTRILHEGQTRTMQAIQTSIDPDEPESQTRILHEQVLEERKETATQSLAPKTRKRTPRDDVWDAVVKVCGITEVTKSLSGQIASSVQQLCDVGAIPGQVHVRAQRYGLKYPGAALTPTALAKHWGLLGEGYIPPVQSRDFRAERVQQVADANAWMNHQGTA